MSKSDGTNAENEDGGDGIRTGPPLTKSPIDQPEPESLWRRIRRTRVAHACRLGVEYQSTQEFLPVEKAFRDSYAVLREDGALIGAIEVEPANMATKDDHEWRKQVDDLARMLAAEIDYPCDWFSPMRSVDYERRRDRYARRRNDLHAQAEQLLADARDASAARQTATDEVEAADTIEEKAAAVVRRIEAETGSGTPEALAERSLTTQLLGDIADERSRITSMLQQTTMTREFYFLVSVEPEDVVGELGDDEGLTSLPMMGDAIKQQRVKEQEGTDEHLRDKLDLLERRVESVAESVRTLDGIKTRPLSSSELSVVMADHFRGEDVYAYDDFAALIREDPVPTRDEAGDPAHSLTYNHLDEYDQGAHAPRPVEDLRDTWTEADHVRFTLGEDVDSDRDSDSDHKASADDLREVAEAPQIDKRLAYNAAAGAETDPEVGGADASGHDDAAADGGTAAQTQSGESHYPDQEHTLYPTTPTANIALTEPEVKHHYQSRLAPEEIDRREAGFIRLDKQWCSKTLVIREWPDRPPMGVLEDILNYDKPGVRVTVNTHFEGLDVNEERRKLESTKQSLQQKADVAEERGDPRANKRRREAEAAADVKEAVEDADTGLFATNTYIELRAPSIELANEAARQIKSRLKELNADAKPFSYHHAEGYLAAAPTVEDCGYSPARMLGSGLAALIQWTSHNLIEEGGVEIGTHADRCEPTIMDLFNRGTGYNMGIFGDIGSGKTTTLKLFLLRLWLSMNDVTMVWADPLQEGDGLCKAFNGERITIGGSNATINPLHLEAMSKEKLAEIGDATPLKDAKRRFMSFVGTYYDLEGLRLGKKKGVWQLARDLAFEDRGITRDPETHHRTPPDLRDVMNFLYDIANNPDEYTAEEIDQDNEAAISDLRERAIDIVNNDLGPFKEGGVYSHLVGQTNIDITEHESNFLYLDLQRYEGEQRVGLMMQLLVNQIYEQAKTSDSPTVFAMDESHYMLQNSYNLKFLKQAVRHSRHHLLSLIFSTQSVSEFFVKSEDGDGVELSESAEIIVNNMAVRVFHYLSEMNDQWADEFGLTQNEKEYIDEASEGDDARGYSEALLQIDQKGCYPIRVEMSRDLNPRERALVLWDPSEPEQPDDFYTHLHQEADWSWGPQANQQQRAAAGA